MQVHIHSPINGCTELLMNGLREKESFDFGLNVDTVFMELRSAQTTVKVKIPSPGGSGSGNHYKGSSDDRTDLYNMALINYSQKLRHGGFYLPKRTVLVIYFQQALSRLHKWSTYCAGRLWDSGKMRESGLSLSFSLDTGSDDFFKINVYIYKIIH